MPIKSVVMEEEKTISIEEHEKVKKILSEEILRRDKIIGGLKRENDILIKTALKRSEELNDARARLDMLLEDKRRHKE